MGIIGNMENIQDKTLPEIQALVDLNPQYGQFLPNILVETFTNIPAFCKSFAQTFELEEEKVVGENLYDVVKFGKRYFMKHDLKTLFRNNCRRFKVKGCKNTFTQVMYKTQLFEVGTGFVNGNSVDLKVANF